MDHREEVRERIQKIQVRSFDSKRPLNLRIPDEDTPSVWFCSPSIVITTSFTNSPLRRFPVKTTSSITIFPLCLLSTVVHPFTLFRRLHSILPSTPSCRPVLGVLFSTLLLSNYTGNELSSRSDYLTTEELVKLKIWGNSFTTFETWKIGLFIFHICLLKRTLKFPKGLESNSWGLISELNSDLRPPELTDVSRNRK